MNRLGLGVATAALVLLSACGGSDDSSDGAEPTSAPATQAQFVEICPDIQEALDAAFVGDDLGNAAEYASFADKISGLVEGADKYARPVLRRLVTASETASDEAVDDPLAGQWLDEMKTVTDMCQQLGAPLG